MLSRTRIAVGKDSAADMSADDFRFSSLAYLANFGYGSSKNLRKIDYLNEVTAPVIVELDISKPPKAGEEVTLTCTIASLHDVPDWSLQIDFYRRLGDGTVIEVPGSNLLVKGELQWHGSLRQAEPTVFTTTIKFPEEGDWKIHAGGNSQENIDKHKGGYGDNLDITVSSTITFYGWKPQYNQTTTSPTQSSALTTTTTTGTSPH